MHRGFLSLWFTGKPFSSSAAPKEGHGSTHRDRERAAAAAADAAAAAAADHADVKDDDKDDEEDLADFIGRPEEANVRVKRYDALHPPRPVAVRSDHHSAKGRAKGRRRDGGEDAFQAAMRKNYVE